jgi:hypothetical protein
VGGAAALLAGQHVLDGDAPQDLDPEACRKATVQAALETRNALKGAVSSDHGLVFWPRELREETGIVGVSWKAAFSIVNYPVFREVPLLWMLRADPGFMEALQLLGVPYSQRLILADSRSQDDWGESRGSYCFTGGFVSLGSHMSVTALQAEGGIRLRHS